MSDPAVKPWTVDQFFAWQARQTERYELVSGVPVRMMAGAGNVHDDIVVNLLAELRGQLRGSGCRPFTDDGSLETLPGQIRRPDVGVDCGQRDPDGMKAGMGVLPFHQGVDQDGFRRQGEGTQVPLACGQGNGVYHRSATWEATMMSPQTSGWPIPANQDPGAPTDTIARPIANQDSQVVS